MFKHILIVFISILVTSTLLAFVMAWPMRLAARIGCDRKTSLARAFLAFWSQNVAGHCLVFLFNIVFLGARPPVSNLPESWIGTTLALLLCGWLAYGKLLFPANEPPCSVKGRIGLSAFGTIIIQIVNIVMLYFFLYNAAHP